MDIKVLTPPGERIEVNGRKIHIQRSGSGSPTVVFESGLISDSFAFHSVQPEIAQVTSTISYDRAGHGYSDPSPNVERTNSVIAEELFDLLETLELSEALVLVGWSAGAQYILKFAEQHPDRVAGLVLLDSPPLNDLDPFPDDIVQVVEQDRDDALDRFTRFSGMKKKEILAEFGSQPPWQNRHPDTHKYYQDTTSPDQFKYFFQLLSTWRKEIKEGNRTIKRLGEMPLTVLYAVEETSPVFTAEQNKGINTIWADQQSELAALSTNNRLIEVNCGHDIANEEPEIVTEAIVEVVNQVRSA